MARGDIVLPRFKSEHGVRFPEAAARYSAGPGDYSVHDEINIRAPLCPTVITTVLMTYVQLYCMHLCTRCRVDRVIDPRVDGHSVGAREKSELAE